MANPTDEDKQRAQELAARRGQEPGSRLAAAKDRAATDFKTADTERLKKQQAFEQRFKTPMAREAALDVEDDARQQKDQIESETATKVQQLFKNLDVTRPVPPEFARHINEQTAAYLRQQQIEFRDIDKDLDQALSQIEARQHEIERIGPIEESHQLTYQPDYPKAFERAAKGPDHDLDL